MGFWLVLVSVFWYIAAVRAVCRYSHRRTRAAVRKEQTDQWTNAVSTCFDFELLADRHGLLIRIT
jgi:hypothetical protein